jgi:hypothetical protein
MSCLDTFCIFHIKEKDDFIRVSEKGLLLNKANFPVNSYKINEHRFPRNPGKTTLSRGKKKKVDDFIDLLEDDLND